MSRLLSDGGQRCYVISSLQFRVMCQQMNGIWHHIVWQQCKYFAS